MNKAAKVLTSILLAIGILSVSWNHPATAASPIHLSKKPNPSTQVR
ncbi:hypothetical protein [Paenibacillus wulumuqiensis]|nr:hypothetical protein [Paenibacillus wulumuqiensis]